MTIADMLMTFVHNTKKVFDAGYLEGQEAGGYNEGFEDGRDSAVDADKIIVATATGKGLVQLDDVSEVNHKVTVHTTAGAKVTVSGKNLFDGNLITSLVDDANFKVSNVESYKLTYRTIKIYLRAGTYTLSANSDIRSAREIKDGVYTTVNFRLPTTFTVATDGYYGLSIRNNDNAEWNDDTRLQIEIGDKATEYESYKPVTEYVADSNGLVTAASISPNMNIASDGDMIVEYRKSWGMQAEYVRFWDSFQDNGNPKDYSCTFGAGWTVESFRPKHDIVATNAYMMFRGNMMEIDLEAHLEALGVKLDFSKAGNMQYLFQNAMFTRIGEVNLSGSANTAPGDTTFANCQKLKTIDKIILKTGSRGEFTANAFQACGALEEVRFEGMITSDVDIHWSTKLSKNSIYSVLFAADLSIGQTQNRFTVTLSRAAVNKAFETSEGANDGEESWEWLSYISNTESYYTTTLL